jgi:hypothetical protein
MYSNKLRLAEHFFLGKRHSDIFEFETPGIGYRKSNFIFLSYNVFKNGNKRL